MIIGGIFINIKKNWIVFSIAMVISTFILMIPTVFSIYYILKIPAEPSNDIDYTVGYFPTQAENMTVLIAGRQKGKTIGSVVLVKFSPIDEKISLTAVPAQIMIEYGGRVDTLSSMWKINGAQKATSALSQTLGIVIDRYADIEVPEFISLADSVGLVEFDVPTPIRLEGGLTAVEEGVQPLDGRKVVTLITYRQYPLGEQQRLALLEDLAVSAINQRLAYISPKMLEILFGATINACQSNVTYNDFHFRKGGIYHLGQKENPAISLSIQGNNNRDTFVMSAESLEAIREVYGE